MAHHLALPERATRLKSVYLVDLKMRDTLVRHQSIEASAVCSYDSMHQDLL